MRSGGPVGSRSRTLTCRLLDGLGGGLATRRLGTGGGASSALTWSPTVDGEFTAEIRVEVAAERGIIAILASRVTDQNATIEQIRVNERDAHTNIVALTLKVKNRVHLANIMRRIRNLKPVQKVYRIKN